MKTSYLLNFLIFVVVTSVITQLIPNQLDIIGLLFGAAIFMVSEYVIGKNKLMQKKIPRGYAIIGILLTSIVLYNFIIN